MDATEKPRRRRWRQKRWCAIGLAWLVIIQAASPGRARDAVARRRLSPESYNRLFRPAGDLTARLLGTTYVRYVRWCEYAGYRAEGWVVEEIVPGSVSLERREEYAR